MNPKKKMIKKINDGSVHESALEEKQAWTNMFDTIAKVFGVNEKTLNEPKYRKVFEMIERWAYYDKLLSNQLRKEGSPYADGYGIFWKGESNE